MGRALGFVGGATLLLLLTGCTVPEEGPCGSRPRELTPLGGYQPEGYHTPLPDEAFGR